MPVAKLEAHLLRLKITDLVGLVFSHIFNIPFMIQRHIMRLNFSASLKNQFRVKSKN